MKLFYLITVYQIAFLYSQSKLDSLNFLINEYEDKITTKIVKLDSLQKTLYDLQAKYAEERFLLMEKSVVKRMNRAAFAGMWIKEPLKGKRIEIRGFGTFSTRKRETRIARNPKTGRAIKVNSKYHPYFRAAKSLKTSLKD